MKFFENDSYKDITNIIFDLTNNIQVRKVNKFCKNRFDERYPIFMNAAKILDALPENIKKHWRTDIGKQFLKKQLIKPDDIEKIDIQCLQLLLTEKVLKYIEKNLFTIEKIISYNSAQLKIILTDNGLKALAAEKINPEMNLKQLTDIIHKLGDNENSPETPHRPQNRF